MNVLILSCNTGGGHNAAARAVAEVFRAHGDEAVVLDYLKLAGEKVSRTVGNVYVETVKIAPGLFGLLYKIGMLVSRLLRRSPVYYVNGKMAVYLAAYLKKHPADVIVMPHLYPAETITYMKRKGMKLPAHGGGDDGLYLYPVLGRDGLRLLYDSARESDPGDCEARNPGRKAGGNGHSGGGGMQ